MFLNELENNSTGIRHLTNFLFHPIQVKGREKFKTHTDLNAAIFLSCIYFSKAKDRQGICILISDSHASLVQLGHVILSCTKCCYPAMNSIMSQN